MGSQTQEGTSWNTVAIEAEENSQNVRVNKWRGAAYNWLAHYAEQKARRLVIETIDTRVKLAPDSRILDVGCGPGKWLNLFADRGFRATGVDSSPWMIRLARKATRGNAGRISFAVADIGQTDFPSDFYDMVNCVTVLQHILDDRSWRSAIREMVRVVKPSGHVLIFEAAPSFIFRRRTRHLRFRSMNEYVREFGRAGSLLSYWRATDLSFPVTYLGLRKYAASFNAKVYYFTGGGPYLSQNLLSFMTRVAAMLAKPIDSRLAVTPLSHLSIGKLLLFRKASRQCVPIRKPNSP